MKNPFRSEPKTSRSYPAAGTSVSGPSGPLLPRQDQRRP